MKTWHLVVPLALAGTTPLAQGTEGAVAANFTGPMENIAPPSAQATGHEAIVASGTIAEFYSQIANGAPFDVSVPSSPEPTIVLGENITQAYRFVATGTAVLLKRGERNEAAKALLVYLHGEPRQSNYRSFGYTL